MTYITPIPPDLADRPGVLVVDDEEALRMNLSRALTRAGFRVSVAGNGAEALAQLEQDPNVHVVVTDLVMPVMDGRQLAQRLATLYPKMCVICMTGYADGLDDGPPNSAWSPERIIAKPFSMLELVGRIRACLGELTP